MDGLALRLGTLSYVHLEEIGVRVCFVNNLYEPCALGGAQMCVQELAERLAEDGNHVTVVATAESATRESYRLNGVEVVKIPLFNVYNPYAENKFAKHGPAQRIAWHMLDRSNRVMKSRLVSEEGFRSADVVSFNVIAGFSTSVWPVAARLGIPAVVNLHDYYAVCSRSAMYRTGEQANCEVQCSECSVMRSKARPRSESSDAVVAVSEFVKARHLRAGLFHGVDWHVIPNGVAPLGELPTPSEDSVKVLGYLGALIPEKGVELLVDAVRAMGEQAPKVLIFGDGDSSYVAKLRERAGPSVIWRGVVPARQALSEVDALVVPSLWEEPFGRVVIEALSAGRPVVGSRRGGISEILHHCEAGWLFEPDGGGAGLAVALEELMSTDASSLSRLRKQAILRAGEFRIETWYGKHKSLLEELAGKKVRSG